LYALISSLPPTHAVRPNRSCCCCINWSNWAQCRRHIPEHTQFVVNSVRLNRSCCCCINWSNWAQCRRHIPEHTRFVVNSVGVGAVCGDGCMPLRITSNVLTPRYCLCLALTQYGFVQFFAKSRHLFHVYLQWLLFHNLGGVAFYCLRSFSSHIHVPTIGVQRRIIFPCYIGYLVCTKTLQFSCFWPLIEYGLSFCTANVSGCWCL